MDHECWHRRQGRKRQKLINNADVELPIHYQILSGKKVAFSERRNKERKARCVVSRHAYTYAWTFFSVSFVNSRVLISNHGKHTKITSKCIEVQCCHCIGVRSGHYRRRSEPDNPMQGGCQADRPCCSCCR